MSEKSIDYFIVNELIEIMDGDMAMLVDSYVKDSRSKLSRLGKLNPLIEQDSIFRLMHSLKGASRNIGILAFAEYCEIIELQARDGRLEQTSLDQQKLNRLFNTAIKDLKQTLSN